MGRSARGLAKMVVAKHEIRILQVKAPVASTSTAYFSVPREAPGDGNQETAKGPKSSLQNVVQPKEGKKQDKATEVKEKSEELSAIEELNLLKEELAKTAEKAGAEGGSKALSFQSFDEDADKERRRKRLERNTRIGGVIVFGSTVAGFVVFCLYYGRAKRDEAGNIVPDEWTGSYLAPFYRIVNSFRVWRDNTDVPSVTVGGPLPVCSPDVGYMEFDPTSSASVYRKDLSKLNRDLSKVIFIDVDPKAAQLNPENILLVPEWKGNMDDTSLVDLAELLKTLHLSDVEDVRPTLQYYSQFPDPAKEFRRRAIYLAEQEEQKRHQREEEGHSLLKKYSGRLFGFRRHAPT
ncbi:NLI interacting factor-like phosphatase [Teladorsagia circumcincta]|uniref:Mitochondrial import inner membrane translocase subunit TIM50 n=1 Tax=Teladorsagia circumcincta TaxID=45464 RepID=A0A2G9V1D6_TELCI|nr:NLI interacting factor-like phosphatase [Teladorsagia circumcincta]